MIAIDQLIPHAKPGSSFSPLDLAELMTLNEEGDTESLRAAAQEIINRPNIAMDVRTILNNMEGVQQKAHDPVELMRTNIRTILGTTNMEYPEDEPEAPSEEDLVDGVELDFGDETDVETPKPPSPLLKITTAVIESVGRAAQRSGQTSTMRPLILKLEKAFEKKDISILAELYTKHTRELAMMVPYMAMDDELEKAMTEVAETYPLAAHIQPLIVDLRDQISKGVQPITAFAAAFTMLWIHQGVLEHNAA